MSLIATICLGWWFRATAQATQILEAGHGAQVVEYEGVYRLCSVRGPEGILIGPAEQIG